MINPAHHIRHLQSCIITCTADCNSVLELGSGLGDKLAFCRGKQCHGVEVHEPYIAKARERFGWEFTFHVASMRDFCYESLLKKTFYDGVMLIDSIEHITKEEGVELLDYAKQIARQRIIIFTPNGYQKQEEDTYGLGGEEWQRHRSGWTVRELTGLGFDVAYWNDYHGTYGALFAIWNQS